MIHPYIPLLRVARFVEVLVRDHVAPPGAGDRLDYARLARIPDDWVPDGPRYADVAWAAPLRDPGPDGPTHAVLLFKCESVVRADASDRLARHRDSLARAFDRNRAFGHPRRPAEMVPVVLYNGATPWDAPGAVRPARRA